MKNIQECAKFYKKHLLKKTFRITLENDIVFEIYFTTKQFYHLMGLHKLTDKAELSKDNNTTDVIYKKILRGLIKPSVVTDSVNYYKISSRIENFENIIELLDVKKTKIIIDFDYTLINECDLKNTEYILYRHENDSYKMLTIGKKSYLYPETFFVENSKKYISEQMLLEIVNIEVIDYGKKRTS